MKQIKHTKKYQSTVIINRIVRSPTNMKLLITEMSHEKEIYTKSINQTVTHFMHAHNA